MTSSAVRKFVCTCAEGAVRVLEGDDDGYGAYEDEDGWEFNAADGSSDSGSASCEDEDGVPRQLAG